MLPYRHRPDRVSLTLPSYPSESVHPVPIDTLIWTRSLVSADAASNEARLLMERLIRLEGTLDSVALALTESADAQADLQSQERRLERRRFRLLSYSQESTASVSAQQGPVWSAKTALWGLLSRVRFSLRRR